LDVDLSGVLLNQFKKAKKEYERAKREKKEMVARRKALECAKLLREMAKYNRYNERMYLEMAEKWELVADNIGEVLNPSKVITSKPKESQEEVDKFKSFVRNNLIQTEI